MNPTWPGHLSQGRGRRLQLPGLGQSPVGSTQSPTARPGEQRVLCGQGATRRARRGRKGQREAVGISWKPLNLREPPQLQLPPHLSSAHTLRFLSLPPQHPRPAGVPEMAATVSPCAVTRTRVCSHSHPHTERRTHHPALTLAGFPRAAPERHEYALLTSIGDCEAVCYLQIVDVRCESELRSGKLNHPYPKCTVFLICAPGKEPPCKEQTPSRGIVSVPGRKRRGAR